MRARRLLGQHPVRWALLVATLTVAGVYLSPKASQALHDLRHLHGANAAWLGLALAAEAASLAAFSGATWVLISPDVRPSFSRVVRLDLVTVALSHAVPAGSAAGTALGVELLEEEGVDVVQSGFVKVSQSLLSTVVLQVLLGVSLILQLALYGPSARNLWFGVPGGVLLLSIAGLGVLLAVRPRAARALVVGLVGWIPRVPAERIGDVVVESAGHLRTLLARPGRLAVVALYSAGNWILDAAALWAALRAFGLSIDPILVAVGFCVAQSAALLPISPAGLGVVESSLIPLLEEFGAAASVALLGVLAWRIVNFWLPLPVGGGAYLLILSDRRRARRARAVGQPVTDS